MAVGFVAGAVLASLLMAILQANRERAERSRLEAIVQSTRSQGDALARLEAENSRLSNRIAHSDGRLDQTPNELLRLRGEVGRLRREIANAQSKTETNRDQVGQEQTSNLVPEGLAVSEVDLDALMNVPVGATTNDVLAALTKIGAHLVVHEPSFIEAGMSVPTTNIDLSGGVLLSFYFEGNKLRSKTYMRLPR